MPIQAVENLRLYRQIADQLSALIAAGEFPEGSRLPSERELASQLGVSRPSVREALIALEVEGKVEVRVGAGIFVALRRPVPVGDPTAEGPGPFELLRARRLLEGEIAFEAARHLEDSDLRAIEAAVDDMQARQRQNKNADVADRNFHVAIAKATKNSALVSVVYDLWDRGRGTLWKRMEQHFQTPELRAATLRDHRAIATALAARDGRRARLAMREHLDRVDREFSQGWALLKDQQRPGSRPSSSSSSKRTRAV